MIAAKPVIGSVIVQYPSMSLEKPLRFLTVFNLTNYLSLEILPAKLLSTFVLGLKPCRATCKLSLKAL